jgi:hypothetical protein
MFKLYRTICSSIKAAFEGTTKMERKQSLARGKSQARSQRQSRRLRVPRSPEDSPGFLSREPKKLLTLARRMGYADGDSPAGKTLFL